MTSLLLLGISLLAGTPTSACAVVMSAGQQSHNATVHGKITDPTGVVLGHAQVLLKMASGERVYRRADGNGCYSFIAPSGDYKVFAIAQGFRSNSITVHLTEGRTGIGNLALDVGGCTNCVRVEGAGTMDLQVQDPTGVPVASSTVTLQLAGETRQIPIQLDDWGRGWIQPPIGKYILHVSAPGFFSSEKTVLITDGQDFAATIELAHRRNEVLKKRVSFHNSR